ncbi:MAG: adenylate/guanylate cyclase domain-containing protein, partial [Pseudobdellovibrionaceae bacterium]
SLLQSYVDKVRLIAGLMYKTYPTPGDRQDAINLSFTPDRDLVAVEVIEIKDGGFQHLDKVVNEDFLKSRSLGREYLEKIRKQKPFPMNSVAAGKFEILNSSIPDGVPLVTIGIPFIKDAYERVSHIAVADIRLEKIQKIFSTPGANEIFLIDEAGKILAHPNDKFSLEGKSFKESPIVAQAITSQFRSNHLPRFQNPDDGKTYYGVFNRTTFGVAVIAQIPEAVILEPAHQVKRQAFYVGALVLSVALFLVFLFSISITQPIEKLLDLTREVARGNFDVDATGKIRSKDEVKDLAIAFDHMTSGLKALVKTQGADVAKALMETDLENLGGTKKDVAVLFSDLRDFTKFSEGHTPEEVVEMLNEYFEVMVGCIEKNKGRVNKFIGDAIMAMWGAPTSTGNDHVLAARAALDMRIALNELNKKRIARNHGPIKIGVGVHCGEAVAGTIGSKSRLEYTIIGDTVNQASRLEASTKAFGSDLLISEAMMNSINPSFIIEFAGAAEVKGKAEALKLYKIKGFINEKGEQVPIITPYSQFEAGDADKVKIAG